MPVVEASDIRGVWATILCRLSDDGEVDLGAIGEQVTAHARAGCNGVYYGGTASEFHCQSDTQFRAIASELAEAAQRDGLPFQICAAHPLAPAGLERIAFAATLAPTAIQVTLPDWTPLDADSVSTFMARCAAVAGSVPLVLYNPPHAKTVLSPAALHGLAMDVPTLIGLKCGGGDDRWYHAMAPVLQRLSVFIPGHHYASGVAQGASGSYSNMACLSPKAAVDWARTDPVQALAIEARIAQFLNDAIAPLLARGLPGFVCDKAMAAAGGWTDISPAMMWPYHGATAAEVARIQAAARHHIPEFTLDMDPTYA